MTMLHNGFLRSKERTPIKEGERVPVEVSVEQRRLVEEHTLVGPDLLQLLGHSGENAPATSTMLSLDDLEELIGYIAFEANHTDDRRLRKRLDQLFAHFQDILDSYEDIYED